MDSRVVPVQPEVGGHALRSWVERQRTRGPPEQAWAGARPIFSKAMAVSAAGALRIRLLSKADPGGVRVRTRVSRSVEPGCVLALLGPNGAGKTTLVHAT